MPDDPLAGEKDRGLSRRSTALGRVLELDSQPRMLSGGGSTGDPATQRTGVVAEADRVDLRGIEAKPRVAYTDEARRQLGACPDDHPVGCRLGAEDVERLSGANAEARAAARP